MQKKKREVTNKQKKRTHGNKGGREDSKGDEKRCAFSLSRPVFAPFCSSYRSRMTRLSSVIPPCVRLAL